MPRVRINTRDLDDLDDLDMLDELDELDDMPKRGGARDREERRNTASERSIERRQHERRRGKEIARHLRRLNQRPQ
jgi:hypothetical protein